MSGSSLLPRVSPRALRQVDEQSSDRIDWKNVVDGSETGAVLRHLAEFRILLHDGYAAPVADVPKPDGAIRAGAGEQQPDDARTVCNGGRAKERIDRGAVAVLVWSTHASSDSWLDEEMVIGRREIDPCFFER